MIEIRTILDYRDFLEKMTSHHRLDNFMLNFIRAFSNIRVGCSCKKKARIENVNAVYKDLVINVFGKSAPYEDIYKFFGF